MKRLTCLAMAFAIIFSLLLMQSPAVYAENEQPGQETLNNTPEATPEPTPEPSAEPTAEQTPAPTPEPTPESTPAPTPDPTPESTPEQTPAPTPDPSIPSGGPFTFSNSGLNFVKSFEGFTLYPKWDYNQYTVGYGTKCPSDKLSYYREHGISTADAEALLSKEIASFAYEVNKFISRNNLKLTQNQFDALVSFSYNVGYAWMYDSTGTMWNAIVKGYKGNDLIRAFGLWSLAGGSVLTGLLRRRLSEANMYINGLYATSAPANYGYVIYDANGGSVSPKSQCYDSNDPAPIRLNSVSREGMTFAGWFTAKVGGEEVKVLDSSVRNKTLYARWALDGVVEDGKLDTPVTVTVTAYSVNLRKGPGTNYGIVGGTYQGKTFVITHVVEGGDYLWGMSGDCWIALEFTNYEEIVKPEPPVTEPPVTEPPVTEPPVTEPPVTEPPVTEPPVTEPPATEPPATEPPVTEPPVTEPPIDEPPAVKKVMGTVNAPAGLMIRSGPGTGYSSVGALSNKARVEILEQKNVGAMVWGRIDRGWISLTYVELDEPIEPEEETAILTGTVNCYCLIVRKGAGSSNAAVDYLYKGDRVEVFEKKTVSGMPWGRIENGWVCLDYITADKEVASKPPVAEPPVTEPPVTEPPVTEPPVTEPPATEPPASDVKQVTGTVNANPNLCIRKGPGTSYGVVGAYYSGTKVTILEQTTVGGVTWGKTNRGWISLSYVVLDTAPTEKVYRTVDCYCLIVRSGAGTSYSVASYLYSGTKVEILEQKTVSGVAWGRISSGWICLDFTK